MKKFFIKLAYKFSRKPFLGKMAVFVSLVFVGSLIWTRTVGATGSLSAEGLAQGIMQFGIWAFLSLGELCVKLSVFCLYLFIKLAEYNNYIDLSVVQLGWTMVRDVANMFFVVVLLIIAIGTILGLEQYQWNKTLVKMILAAVFINFSNMICGLFIDVAHVFTITFVNAISATAGGNLISMFKLDRLYDMVYKQPLGEDAKFDVRLFAGACVSFLFAVLTLVTIAAYLVVMLTRVVMLWVLIILSPIAYIAQTLPQGQSYAKEWWDEFSKHVLVAPVMVFFLWLAFATAGSGDLVTGNVEQQKMGIVMNQEAGTELIEEAKEPGEVTTVALTEVATWENMANIIIAIALLWAGLERVQKLGVRGGGMVAKGMDMFKNIATVATGVAAGRWMARKGWETAKKPVAAVGKFATDQLKGAYMNVPFLGGHALTRTWNQLDEWRRDNKWVKHLPLVGGFRDDYNYKMNERQKKQMTMSKERRYREMSYEKPILDQVGKKLDEFTGGVLGFGLSTSSRRKNMEEARLMSAKLRAETRGKERQESVRQTLSEMADAQLKIFIREDGMDALEKTNAWQDTVEGKQWRDEWLGKHGLTENDLSKSPEMRERLNSEAVAEWGEKTEEGKDFVKNQAKRQWDFLYNYKSTFGSGARRVMKLNSEENVQGAFRAWKEQDKDGRKNASLEDFLRTDDGYNAQFIEEDRTIQGKKAGKIFGLFRPGMDKTQREAVAAMVGALFLEQNVATYKEGADKAKEDAMMTFRQTALGKSLIKEGVSAEELKKIGADYLKGEKNAVVEQKYGEAKGTLDDIQAGITTAREKIKKAKTPEEKEEAEQELRDHEYNFGRLLSSDGFIRSVYFSEEAKSREGEAKAARVQAEKSFDQVEGVEWVDYQKAQQRIADLMKEEGGVETTKEWQRHQKGKEIFDSVKELADEQGIDVVKAAKEGLGLEGEELNLFEEYQNRVAAGKPEPALYSPENQGRLDKIHDELAELEGMPKPERETQRMRAAGAEMGVRSAEAYMKAAKRNSLRSNQAAGSLEALDRELAVIDKEKSQTTDSGRIERLNDRRQAIMDRKNDLIEADPYAATVHYEQKAALAEMQTKQGMDRILKSWAAPGGIGEDIVKRITDAEIGSKIGEDFVKSVKEAHLSKEYDKVADKMKGWANLSVDALKQKTDEALLSAGASVYLKTMGQSQLTKMETEASGIRKRQAEDAAHDAFVAKPRYGITTPSTALSDYSDTKMKEYRKLERAAAAKKASDMMVSLNHQKNMGKTLTIDQEAELFAATSLLSEEAWIDDSGDYIYKMFGKLRNGQLRGADKDQWTEMAKSMNKLGWFKEQDGRGFFKKNEKGEDVIDTDYKFVATKQYDRIKARDLQALGQTGGDVDLLRVHRAIEKKDHEQTEVMKVATAKAKDEKIDELLADKSAPITQEYEKVAQDGRVAKIQEKREGIKKAAMARGKTEEEAGAEAWGTLINLDPEEQQAIVDVARASVEEKAKLAIQEAVDAAKDKLKKAGKVQDYVGLASSVLKDKKQFGLEDLIGMDSVGDLKDRYEKYADFMQDGLRANKASALKTGHPELGANNDFDDMWDGYRLTLEREGDDIIRSERVKMKARQLISNEQRHAMGTLDFETFTMDDFLESQLSTSIGRATKELDISDIALRTLRNLHLLHADESASTVEGQDEKAKTKGKRLAVIGGEKFRGKMINDGDVTLDQQEKHMLLRSTMASVLAGGTGFALGLKKDYEHIKEHDAQNGIINVKIGGKEYASVDDLANGIANLLQSMSGEETKKYLDSTQYAHDDKNTLIRRLRVLANTMKNKRLESNNGGADKASKNGRGGRAKPEDEVKDNEEEDTMPDDT